MSAVFTLTLFGVTNPITIPELSLDEQQRLAALHACEILDTLPEAEFDELVELAQQACETPAAAISFIDSDRQWLKGARGPVRGVARSHSFCDHTIRSSQPLVVQDACQDPRFADNPYVAGEPGIRFYAGVPLVTSEGARVGAICVLDRTPRALDGAQLRTLEILARQVSSLLDLRRQKATLQAALAERDAAVIRLELVQQLRTDTADAPDAAGAGRALVRAVAERGGWAAGALWCVRGDGGPLMNVGGYHVDGVTRALFAEASLQAVFTRGVGLPGAVWRAGSAVWLENLMDEPGMLRISAMRAAGLSSGAAVPVVLAGRVIGVLEMLAEHATQQDELRLDLLGLAAVEAAPILARCAPA